MYVMPIFLLIKKTKMYIPNDNCNTCLITMTTIGRMSRSKLRKLFLKIYFQQKNAAISAALSNYYLVSIKPYFPSLRPYTTFVSFVSAFVKTKKLCPSISICRIASSTSIGFKSNRFVRTSSSSSSST